jgi:hypothetical protein
VEKKAASVSEAIRLAEEAKRRGQYDWFRGQAKRWPLVSSLNRLSDVQREESVQKLARYAAWIKHTPGLEELASHTDSALAVAQHYGLPTNFVDFTTEPSIAGFFATHGLEASEEELACILCLDTKDLSRFCEAYSRVLPQFEQPEYLALKVSNLWRLEAQHGVFLFLPHVGFEKIYDFDRIVFPRNKRADLVEEEVYPERRSQLEILIQQFFMNEQLLQGKRTIQEMGVTMISMGSPHAGYDMDFFVSPPERLPCWEKNVLGDWLQQTAEPWSQARQKAPVLPDGLLASDFRANRTQIETHLLDLLKRRILSRDVPVEWMLPQRLRPLAETLSHQWDGMRRLPYTDAQLMGSLATTVALGVQLTTEPDLQTVFDREVGESLEVEFGPEEDGSYSRALVAGERLAGAMRRDLSAFAAPEHIEDMLEYPSIALQACWRAPLLFDFAAFTQIFAEQVVPTQVLLRPSGLDTAIIFSPARSTVFGLP